MVEDNEKDCSNCIYCFLGAYDRYCLALPKPVSNSNRWKPCVYYKRED